MNYKEMKDFFNKYLLIGTLKLEEVYQAFKSRLAFEAGAPTLPPLFVDGNLPALQRNRDTLLKDSGFKPSDFALAKNTSGTNTGDETAVRVAIINHGTAAKSALVDADEVTGQDSANSYSLIRSTWANVKTYLKTYFDTLYAPTANGVTNGNSHAHVGGAGAQIDHTTLSNIGTNTHAQIDTALALVAGAETTFTPTIIGSTTPGTQTYSTQVGTYRTIGDMVFIQIYVAISAKGGAMAGYIQIGGLPFPAASGNTYGVITIGDYTGITFDSGYTQLGCRISPGTSVITLREQGSAKTGLPIAVANLAATSSFMISGFYFI